MIIFDKRWFGKHGIGRFAKEVYVRCSVYFLDEMQLCGYPYKFYDCIYLSLKLCLSRSFYFSPGYNSPLFGGERCIITVHDLNHIDFPLARTLLKTVYYKVVLRRSIRKANCVLTVSEYSKSRIIEWSGVNADKVINVGNGVDASFSPDVVPYKPGYDYFLCVGNRKLHKNEARVIESFHAADIPSNVKLVFNGSPSEQLQSLIDKLSLSDRVIFVGMLDDKDLPGLYAGAKGLLFPSLYEGFGLPLVEAMAVGTPVLTSNVTSLPEIAGDAAILVDPYSVEDIQRGIESLYHDDNLRHSLIEKGLLRAKFFSWDSVASRVKTVLDRIKMEGFSLH